MRLAIKADRLISEVQNDFSQAYPFLKIEFFRNRNVNKEHYSPEKQIAHYLRVKDAWFRNRSEGELEISNTMTVSELEDALVDQFGLSAQLFRKSGNLWLETTITDNWTLKQQNDHGREISTEHRRIIRDDNDYDLSR